MIERDYIMRILKQFFDALNEVVNKLEPNSNREHTYQQLNELCADYLGKDLPFFINADNDHIMMDMEGSIQNEALAKVTILSELLYHSANLQSDKKTRENTLGKVLYILKLIDRHSDTYSFERISRISQITALLNGR